MMTRQSYLVVGVVLLATFTSAAILTTCKKADGRVADEESCTRYIICREDPDSAGNFLSDIAVCPSMYVFDMVSSTCVDVKEGYLQDPAGCNTFYGCRLPSQSSEGYLRTRYTCPGGIDGLRFDPDLRFCTYKTSVPDTKCNSHIAVQAILGQQESDQPAEAENSEGGSGGAATQSESASSTQTEDSAAAESESASTNQSGDAGSESSGQSEDPATEAPTEETEAPAESEVDSTNSEVESPTEGEDESFDSNSSTIDGRVSRVVTPGERPARPLTDIDTIAQVIRGQLLTRRKASEAASKPQ